SRWHLHEMAVTTGGLQFWLGRAVDDEGEVLDVLVQRRRDKAAAGKLMRKLLKKAGLRARHHHDRQAGLLWSGLCGAGSHCAARARPAAKQSGGALAPTGPATRTEDAAFQVSRIRSALRLDAFRRLQHLQSSASSDLPPHAAPVPGGSYGALASRGYVTGTVVAPSPPMPQFPCHVWTPPLAQEEFPGWGHW